jgi:O-acetyl-ADP-ribose deacetylase (regulator of RNase III)
VPQDAHPRVAVRFAVPRDEYRHELIMHLVGVPGTAATATSLLECDADAIVSPANSFGWMDGGLDAQLTEKYGAGLEDVVRRRITDEWGGELPVGCALTAPLPGARPSFLIVAPTMRVPMRLPADSINSYLAIRAAIREAQRLAVQRGIDTFELALPAMGTGIGGIGAASFARQAIAAVKAELQHVPPTDWWDASRQHQLLSGPVVRDLQLRPGERAPQAAAEDGTVVVENTVDPLGDRLLATIEEQDGRCIIEVITDDGFESDHVQVTVPSERPGSLLRRLAREHHGDGRALLDAAHALADARISNG